jgi:hypothetical protein
MIEFCVLGDKQMMTRCDKMKQEEGHLKSAARKACFAVLIQGKKRPACPAPTHFRKLRCAYNLVPTRKQISETDCLASSAVARLRLVRMVLLPKKILGVGCRQVCVGARSDEAVEASNKLRELERTC